MAGRKVPEGSPEKNAPERAPELRPVEAWAHIQKTPRAVLAGMMAHAGWKAGRTVTEAEYHKAMAGFLDAPAEGRR